MKVIQLDIAPEEIGHNRRSARQPAGPPVGRPEDRLWISRIPA
jgi:hypothetical protein